MRRGDGEELDAAAIAWARLSSKFCAIPSPRRATLTSEDRVVDVNR